MKPVANPFRLGCVIADIARPERAPPSAFRPSSMITQGGLTEFSFDTESGGAVTNWFCPKCGTTVLEKISMRPNRTSVAAGTFDPPTFWFEITREIFCRTKAPFVSNDVEEKHEDFPGHRQVNEDRSALRGGNKR